MAASCLYKISSQFNKIFINFYQVKRQIFLPKSRKKIQCHL
nr:MAG TPA: hypothetical protein [Caudoviricetes sp.]